MRFAALCFRANRQQLSLSDVLDLLSCWLSVSNDLGQNIQRYWKQKYLNIYQGTWITYSTCRSSELSHVM